MRAGFLFNRLKIRDDFVNRTNVPVDNEPNSTDSNKTTDEVVVVNGKEELFESGEKEQNLVSEEIIVETKDEQKESTPEVIIIPEPVLMNGMTEEHNVPEEFIDLDELKTHSIIDDPIHSIDSSFDLTIKPTSVENVNKEQKTSFDDSNANTIDEYEFTVQIPNGQNLDEKVEVKFTTFDKNVGQKLESFLAKFDFNELSNNKPSSSDDFERFNGNDKQTTSPPLVNIDCGGDSPTTTSDNNPINNSSNTNQTRITYDRETILSLRKNHTLMDLKDSRVIKDILKLRLNLFRC